jgi:hypothetical protein
VELVRIRPGLWRWTARHPEWVQAAEPESPADWPPEVGCVACASGPALVVIDALAPLGDEDAFWRRMDALVEEHGPSVSALTTIGFHRRSRDDFVARYGAPTSRAAEALPEGVEAVPLRGAGEVMFWLAEHRALVAGDRLLGDGSGGLRLCPQSWLRYLPGPPTLGQLRELLRPLLERPIEMVLVSHGEPVLARGRQAVAAALAAAG